MNFTFIVFLSSLFRAGNFISRHRTACRSSLTKWWIIDASIWKCERKNERKKNQFWINEQQMVIVGWKQVSTKNAGKMQPMRYHACRSFRDSRIVCVCAEKIITKCLNTRENESFMLVCAFEWRMHKHIHQQLVCIGSTSFKISWTTKQWMVLYAHTHTHLHRLLTARIFSLHICCCCCFLV